MRSRSFAALLALAVAALSTAPAQADAPDRLTIWEWSDEIGNATWAAIKGEIVRPATTFKDVVLTLECPGATLIATFHPTPLVNADQPRMAAAPCVDSRQAIGLLPWVVEGGVEHLALLEFAGHALTGARGVAATLAGLPVETTTIVAGRLTPSSSVIEDGRVAIMREEFTLSKAHDAVTVTVSCDAGEAIVRIYDYLLLPIGHVVAVCGMTLPLVQHVAYNSLPAGTYSVIFETAVAPASFEVRGAAV